MAGPGGKEVGRVSVRVTPDTSHFPNDLRKDLKELEKTLKLQIPVKLITDSVKEELKKVKDSAKREKITLDAELDGDGLVRETRRIKNLAQKAATAIKFTAAIDYKTTIARIRADLAVINKIVSAYRIRIPVDLVSWGRLLGYATAIAATLLTIPHILGAIGGALAVVGGLFATLPGLAAGAAAGITTLVVGMQGFFKALSSAGDAAAFEEALKNLTPSAQDAAKALAEFREPLSEIRKSVQERLFFNMADSFRQLKDLLPVINDGLTGTAGGIRDMIKAWIEMATTQESQNDLRMIFLNVSDGLKAMKPVLANIGSALKDFAVVGSSFFVEWGAGLTDVTTKFKEWAAEARRTGEMREWIENALDKLRQMGRVLSDIWNGFANISNAVRDGREFLDIVEEMTQAFREFTEQKDVQAAFRNIGKVLGQLVDVGSDVFGELFRTIGDVLKDAMPFIEQFINVLGSVLIGIIKTVGPMLQSLARFFSENKEIVSILAVTLLGVVTAFKLAATAAKGIIAVKDSFIAMKKAGKILADVSKAIGGFVLDVFKGTYKVIAYLAMQAAAFYRWMLAGITSATRVASVWIIQAAKSAAFTARYYAIMAAQAVASFVAITAAAVANAARTAAAWVASWIRMAATALAQAVRMAAAWVIAMGPIGWVIAAIVGLVALIVLNWESIRDTTVAIWNGIWKFVSDIFTDIRDWCDRRLQDVIGFFVALPGNIASALSNIWDVITSPFRSAFDWVKKQINSLADAWDKLTGQIQGGFTSGGIGSIIGREDGGSVSGGKTYLANESGQELFTTTSGDTFLMAGPMGAFTPPVSGHVTSNRDLANALVPLAGNSGSGDSIAEALVSRVLEVMSNWSWEIQVDPSGLTKMVNKTNLMNRRR